MPVSVFPLCASLSYMYPLHMNISSNENIFAHEILQVISFIQR